MSAAEQSTQDQFELERQQARALRKERNLQRQEEKRQRSMRAAELLGRHGTRELDLRLLLDDLPADRDNRWIRFVLPDETEITVARMALRRLAKEAKRNGRMKRGLRAFVDHRGLHVRWATGRLCLRYSRPLSRWEPGILVVPFSEVSGMWPTVTHEDPEISEREGSHERQAG